MTKRKENGLSIALIFVGLIWGGGFIAVQFALDAGFSPIAINFFRFLIATILTFCVFFKSVISIKVSDVKNGIVPSIFMIIGFFLQNTGQQYTTPGNSALITGTYIIMVPFLSAIIAKTKIKGKTLLAAVITFTGITVLSLPSFSGDEIRIGDFLTLLSALFFALHFIALDKALDKVSSSKMTFIQLLFCSVAFGIMFTVFDLPKMPQVDWMAGILALGYLGVFSSFVAYVVQTYSQKYLNATKVAVIMSSECLFGAVLSVIIGFEPVTAYLVVGGALALTGIIIAQSMSSDKLELIPEINKRVTLSEKDEKALLGESSGKEE